MLLNQLHAFSREENKHAFTSYVIPPDWQGKGGLNYPSYKTSNYRKTSNISRTLVGSKIVDNSDVVGASPVGAAPTTSSFST